MMNMKWNKLAVMAILSFVSMYVLMYMMVDTFADALANINQFYMVSMMTAAMMLIEITVMGSMYSSNVKMITVGVSAIVLVASIMAIRGQFAVTDKAFLQSMIPHHGAAVLMCNEAQLQDPEIKNLCAGILKSQQSEIEWMHAKLSSMERSR